MTFPIEPGDVVVCVDNYPDENTPTHLFPMLNRISIGKMYRVTGIVGTPRGLGLTLAETTSPRKSGWAAYRFRKVSKADDGFLAEIRNREPVE